MTRGYLISNLGRAYPIPVLIQLILLMGLSSCVLLPVEKGDKALFKEEQLAFINIGETTKEAIVSAMSDFASEQEGGVSRRELTPVKYRDGQWWLYTQVREEMKWFFIGGYGYSADAGMIGDVDYRFLLIKFDDRGVVADYTLSSSEGLGCNRQGVCVGSGSITLLAPEDDDRKAKQFAKYGDRCGIFVYGDQKVGERILLNKKAEGSLIEKNKYFYLWQIEPGTHTLAVDGTYVQEWNKSIGGTSTVIQCAAGELQFINIDRVRGAYFVPFTEFDIVHVDETIGRREIGKRQLLISPLSSSK